MVSLSAIRQDAASRSLLLHGTVLQAVQHLGYVQADPMRAPARAQDLILRHRVANYRAGDLEAQFEALPLEEDFLINYGYLPRDVALLMHPRTAPHELTAEEKALAKRLLAYIKANGPCHPNDLIAAFGKARATNGWGGQSNATTHLLGLMQYRSLLRVKRRDAGTRVYEPLVRPANTKTPVQRVQALMQVLVQQYAPLTERGLRWLVRFLPGGVPQWQIHVQGELKRLLRTLPGVQVNGQTWYWPDGETPLSAQPLPQQTVRLLAPFDPLVWDRDRFEQLHGWAYRFEAYTPASKRQLGHYALPLMVGSQVLGWANLRVLAGQLHAEIGFTQNMRQYPNLQQETEAELARFAQFMDLDQPTAIIMRHARSVW